MSTGGWLVSQGFSLSNLTIRRRKLRKSNAGGGQTQRENDTGLCRSARVDNSHHFSQRMDGRRWKARNTSLIRNWFGNSKVFAHSQKGEKDRSPLRTRYKQTSYMMVYNLKLVFDPKSDEKTATSAGLNYRLGR